MSGSDKSFLFEWRRAVMNPNGPQDFMVREGGRGKTVSRSAQKLVAMCLADHMDRDGASCFPPLTMIHDETGLSSSTAVNAIGALEAQRWLERDSGGGPRKPNQYRACLPDEYVPAERDRSAVTNDTAERSRMTPLGVQKEAREGANEEAKEPDAAETPAALSRRPPGRSSKQKAARHLSRETTDAINYLLDAIPPDHRDEYQFEKFAQFVTEVTPAGFIEAGDRARHKFKTSLDELGNPAGYLWVIVQDVATYGCDEFLVNPKVQAATDASMARMREHPGQIAEMGDPFGGAFAYQANGCDSQ